MVDAVPPRLQVDSESFEQLGQRLIPKLTSESARAYATDAMMRLFLMSLLDAPRGRLGVPDHLSQALGGTVAELARYFRANRVVGQHALDSVSPGASC